MKVDCFKTPFPRSYWVIPGLLLAGEFPGSKNQDEARTKIRKLVDCGIRQIINLMEPDETDHSGNSFNNYDLITTEIADDRSVSVNCLQFPIADLNVPAENTMEEILDAITDAIDHGKPVYIHCWGGVGRTGTVVGCFLMKNGLANRSNVLRLIADLRKNDPKSYRTSPENEAQCKFVESWLDKDKRPLTGVSRCIGCLIGGAVGDALGAPVEFMNREDILHRFGPEGITAYAPAYGGLGTITDDTQMTLFTAEGLLRAEVRGRHKGITTYAGLVANAYQRWLYTQGEQPSPYIPIQNDGEGAGLLLRQQSMHTAGALRGILAFQL